MAHDSTGNYSEPCLFTGYWQFGRSLVASEPVETIQMTWSASVEWLQSTQADRNIIPPSALPLVGKILLLGANHTL